MIFSNIQFFVRENRVFLFLVVYRWASIFPALVVLLFENDRTAFLVFMAALGANIFISVFNRLLNKITLEHPAFLFVDMLFSAALLGLSGGAYSPYYLYALSPLLAGAFFFQMRGAFLVSVTFTPLYFASLFLGFRTGATRDVVLILIQLAGIWLIPILFAYPSSLLKSIRQANADLAHAHRQLEIIHDLTVLLQAAPDLLSVQQRVLGVVTTDLGFSRALVALVDPSRAELGGWVMYPPQETFAGAKPAALEPENGKIVQALIRRETLVGADELFPPDSNFNEWLKHTQWFVLPLYLREHPVGVLMVDNAELTSERHATLMTVANQAALALGTTVLCIDRARNLAVETERNRIARDIHDTVAQSLFGITYSLEACINMLPAQAEHVKNELMDLRSLALSAHDEVRRSIFDLWPSALTIETFMADLSNYVSSFCRPHSFSIIFNHHGDFNALSPGLRRTIYRMTQEALANSARHSGVNMARVCLAVTGREVYLDVSDQGKGFDLNAALSRVQNREHFGLHGIQERARALGGSCEIISRPHAGSRILITLPIHHHHV